MSINTPVINQRIKVKLFVKLAEAQRELQNNFKWKFRIFLQQQQ